MIIHHLIFDPGGEFLQDLEVYALVASVTLVTIEVHIHDPIDVSKFVKVFLPPN